MPVRVTTSWLAAEAIPKSMSFHRAVEADHDVRRRDIAVHDAERFVELAEASVDVSERLRQRESRGQRFALREPPRGRRACATQELVESDSVHVLHDQPGNAAAFLEADHGNDVGV